jgi:Zn finger protein HypA/HybF involved in hydrogenase expression
MFTIEEIQEAENENSGYCIACGYFQSGVEPDAERYECEDCGKFTVYGTDNLILMGRVM